MSRKSVGIVPVVVALAALADGPFAQDVVSRELRIASGTAGFVGPLDDRDHFGAAVTSLGDLDGDGIPDVAVGAPKDDDGGGDTGAVWILFLNPDGTVRDEQKISDTHGGFTGHLSNGSRFGSAVAGLGDLDGDGVPDLAVGSTEDGDSDLAVDDDGAVWILFLNPDGTVRSHRRIHHLGHGGSSSSFLDEDRFGVALAAIGDVDGDGTTELAIGQIGGSHDDDDFASDDDDEGRVFVAFLTPDGSIADVQEIGEGEGGFQGELHDGDGFGTGLAGPGDLDGDGIPDLTVGAPGDRQNGTRRGAIYVLFLRDDGKVRNQVRIAAGKSGFEDPLEPGAEFGTSLGGLGDLNGDGVPDLMVGATGTADEGGIWLLFLRSDGTVLTSIAVDALRGGFEGDLDGGDDFGRAVAEIGDLDGDGAPELAVGADGDDTGGSSRGATWLLFTPAATQETDNGSGQNPNVYQPGGNPPAIGQVWNPIVVLPFTGEPLFHFMGVSNQETDISTPFGELLISLKGENPLFLDAAPVGQPFDVPIPADTQLIGLELYSQAAMVFPGPSFQLTNSIQIVIGF